MGWKLTVTVTMKAELMWHFLDWQSPERRFFFYRFLINNTYTCQRSNHNRHPIAIVTGNPTNSCSICLSWWMFDTGFEEAWYYVIFPLPAVPRVALSRYHGSETTESWKTKMAPSCNIKIIFLFASLMGNIKRTLAGCCLSFWSVFELASV